MKRIAVIGLGTFGMGLARALSRLGAQVTAVDIDAAHVEALKDEVHAAVRLDAKDRDALAAQNLHECECAVICMGKDFPATEICAVHLTDLGCKRVIVRGTTRERVEILQALVPEVIVPGASESRRLALQLLAPAIRDCAILTGPHHVAVVKVPNSAGGQPLASLKLEGRGSLRVLAVRKGCSADAEIVVGPSPGLTLSGDDCVLLLGTEEDFLKLSDRLGS